MPKINLINQDCMEYMATLPDKAFELAICDPPYGIGDFTQSDATEFKSVKWNDAIPDENYFTELKRISKRRIIWGANYYNCFEEGNGAIIWYKNIGHPSMSHCEIASISKQKKVDFIHINWSGGIRKQQSDYCHPCQKPVALYQWLLKNYAKQGDKILDTHLGSASSAIAADIMGFDFVGLEIDKDYYEAALDRFNRHKQQLVMEF
jgi:site-specific DNA-methyltransferase (adenine-specific)